MPLPLPSLDTRRWDDLVAEGRALIPRHAPAWTDHNVHDPGIMLMELFAWLSEQLMYRANRIPERHLQRFLALAGFPPVPPRPATAVLGAVLPTPGPLAVPEGLVVVADAASNDPTTFRVVAPATLARTTLVAVQGFDGTTFTDLTRAWRDDFPISPLGADPRPPQARHADRAPALLLGFDAAVPRGDPLHLFIASDATDGGGRQRLLAEAAERAAECVPPPGCASCGERWPCADAGGAGPAATARDRREAAARRHHSVRVRWETLGAAGWQAAGVDDETRGLTLDGRVTLTVDGAMAARVIGAVDAPRYWVRCRLVAGRFDATPTLTAIVANALLVEQRQPAWRRFAVAPAAAIVGVPAVGALQPIDLAFDAAGTVVGITVHPEPSSVPRVRVLAFTAPAPAAPGALTLELERLGPGFGFPHQQLTIPGAPVVADSLRVRSHEPTPTGTLTRAWEARGDLDAESPLDAAVAVVHASGALVFGTGVRGRLVPDGATITASYETTRGAAGNVAPARAWTVPDDALNAALAGPALAALGTLALANRRRARAGTDAEDVGAALERAAAFLWSHERLVELADGARQATLDQIAPASVAALEPPERATTVLDYERIARAVPGTRVARARAFAGADPRLPGVAAPGTVTVVVVPHLPADRPTPSGGLLAAVRRHLERRRIVTTRLLVMGPTYVDVGVVATVRAVDAADHARVRRDIVRALDDFLHPLRGGPSGLGWPFGRDVYRSEILATIDRVAGVDHVLALSLTVRRDGAADASRCGNVCVPPTCLIAPLPHEIEVVTA